MAPDSLAAPTPTPSAPPAPAASTSTPSAPPAPAAPPAAATGAESAAAASTAPAAHGSADGHRPSSPESPPSNRKVGSGARRSEGRTDLRSAARKPATSGATKSTTSATPAAHPESLTVDFTAALAQSLAAQNPSGATTTEAVAKPGRAPAHESSSRHKEAPGDPVKKAMALLSQALTVALAPVSAGAVPGPNAKTVAATPAATAGPQHSASQVITHLLSEEANPGPGAGVVPDSVDHGAPTPSPLPATTTAGAAGLTAAALATSHLRGGEPAAASLSQAVGSNGWTEELGAKVVWMASQGIQSASLQVTPQHLGPVQVQISVHSGQASVWFGAPSAETRAALQNALPQLRQMLANGGLMLADAGVSREPPRGQARPTTVRAIGAVGATAETSAASGELSVRTDDPGGLGLIDTYA